MKLAFGAGGVTGFRMKACVSMATLALMALGAPGEARVIRFNVQSTQPFAGGMSFGDTGSFEELVDCND